MTALFLGDLLKMIKAKGWKIIGLKEAFDDEISKTIPDVLFNNQGRIGAIAFSMGAQRGNLVQASEDEAFLENLFSTQKVFK